MADPSGTFHISGGQQNFGGTSPSFTQTNHYYASETAPTEQLQDLIAALRNALPAFADRHTAGEQIVVIEQGLARRNAADGPAVQGALESLAAQVTAGTELADAIAQAIDLVIQHWPF